MMRTVGPVLSALSILFGLFGLFAPIVAWLVQFAGLASFAGRDETAEAIGSLAIMGSYGLAIAIIASAPIGGALGVIALPASWAGERSLIPGVIGILLNLLAPVTWILTWAGFIAFLLWAFQDFHF